ncbi:MAG: hypothetical protein ACXADS_06105 [Candidatus Thorarchaeota archaeon]|jgi:hypothetical protein
MDLFTEIVLLTLTLGMGLILRYIPHRRYYFPSTPDTFFFLNRFKDPEYKADEVIYPPLFQQMFRFLLKNSKTIPDMKLNRIAPLFDTFTAMVLFVFLRGTFGVELALLATFIFFTTPFVVKQGICLSSRSFGFLLFNTSLLCLILPIPLNWIAALPIALTLLSHRLATQTLFFVCVAFTFFDWQAGAILLTGAGLAVLLSKGEYVHVLRNHLSTVMRYLRVSHNPNQRLIGLMLVPSVVGFTIYCGILLLQSLIVFPFSIGGIVVNEVAFLVPYFETLLLTWGAVCLLLLVFWIAGQSYLHTYLAATPFAIFSARILENGPIFFYIVVMLIFASILLSLYFSLHFEHLSEDFVAILRHLNQIAGPVKFLAPAGLVRAAEYFSDKQGAPIYFQVVPKDSITDLINQEDPTHAIVGHAHVDWFSNWKEVLHLGDWYLLEVPE